MERESEDLKRPYIFHDTPKHIMFNSYIKRKKKKTIKL